MKIILTNKLRKHNYNPNLHNFNICRYPDLNQGSPGYKTGAITTTLQSGVIAYTTDKNNLENKPGKENYKIISIISILGPARI